MEALRLRRELLVEIDPAGPAADRFGLAVETLFRDRLAAVVTATIGPLLDLDDGSLDRLQLRLGNGAPDLRLLPA